MGDLKSTTIHRSLHKPNLFFGAEREPILLAALLPIAFTLSAFNLIMLLIGVGFWVTASFFLRAMAKKDPMLGKMWMRFIKYKAYYPAKTSAWWKAPSKIK